MRETTGKTVCTHQSTAAERGRGLPSELHTQGKQRSPGLFPEKENVKLAFPLLHENAVQNVPPGASQLAGNVKTGELSLHGASVAEHVVDC